MILPQHDFCLIRHGQTCANRDGLVAGRTEAQLTLEGRRAAALLAGQDWPRAMTVFSSPQDRARVTAQLAFPGAKLRLVDGLRERDWGTYEGRPIAKLPPRTTTPDQGEGWREFLSRAGAALHLCITQSQGALPVIVAHSGIIRAARLLTLGAQSGPQAPNTTPLLFTYQGGQWQERLLFPPRATA